MYGILYAYTPESFAAPHRGTGDALCAALNRIGGFIAPLIKIATTPKTGTVSANTANGSVLFPLLLRLFLVGSPREPRPVFVSAALFMVSAVLTLFLPIEVRRPRASPGVLRPVLIPMCFLLNVVAARPQDEAHSKSKYRRPWIPRTHEHEYVFEICYEICTISVWTSRLKDL